ncbi:hypothetical protein ACIREM_32835 [Streptomyces shenzhenensis]|uniref:hypothetical protein n=1 Tax=Streptomyces shenzhenensis TaxID=943815 RepID=UPI0037F35063
MTKTPTPSTEARDLRALLETVVQALTLPYDLDDYDARILRRADLVRVLVREALAEQPGNLGWNLVYLRNQLNAEHVEATQRGKNRCGLCRHPFDATDTRFDGHARHAETPWCRSCVEHCHEGGAEHVCAICDPARYGGGAR